MLLLVIAFIDVVAPKRAVCFVVQAIYLCSLSADSAGQLNVLGHDGDALGMDGTQVGVFKESNQVSFASFLKSYPSSCTSWRCQANLWSDLRRDSWCSQGFPRECDP